MSPKVFGEEQIATVSELNSGKATCILKKARVNGPILIMKNNKTVGIVMAVDDYNRIIEDAENYQLLMLAEKRLTQVDLTKTISWEEAKTRLGMSQEDIDSAEDLEIE